MAKLTSAHRHSLPKSEFALPNRKTEKGTGSYPIDTKNRARNALSRVSGNGSSKQKSEVRAKVHAKYPEIGSSSKAGESKGDRKSRLDKWASGK